MNRSEFDSFLLRVSCSSVSVSRHEVGEAGRDARTTKFGNSRLASFEARNSARKRLCATGVAIVITQTRGNVGRIYALKNRKILESVKTCNAATLTIARRGSGKIINHMKASHRYWEN
jgi:hypothetical protein